MSYLLNQTNRVEFFNKTATQKKVSKIKKLTISCSRSLFEIRIFPRLAISNDCNHREQN